MVVMVQSVVLSLFLPPAKTVIIFIYQCISFPFINIFYSVLFFRLCIPPIVPFLWSRSHNLFKTSWIS